LNRTVILDVGKVPAAERADEASLGRAVRMREEARVRGRVGEDGREGICGEEGVCVREGGVAMVLLGGCLDLEADGWEMVVWRC
jgi:hypothetical protein